MLRFFQTVDKPCFAKVPSCMGGCEGGREAPCTFNSRKNRNIFNVSVFAVHEKFTNPPAGEGRILYRGGKNGPNTI